MRQLCIMVLLVTTASAASAADNGIYFGGGIVRSYLDANGDAVAEVLTNTDLDDDDNGFKVIAGIRPLDWFAAEVNYVDFGEISVGNPTTNAEYSLQGIDAFALVLFGPPFLDIYAKLGVISWQSDSESTINAIRTATDDDGFDVAYGAGAQLRFGSFAARLEYERFEIETTDEASAVTLGLTWTFL